MIFASLALMELSRSVSAAASLALNAEGAEKALLRSALLAIRETKGSGSRHSGDEVAA